MNRGTSAGSGSAGRPPGAARLSRASAATASGRAPGRPTGRRGWHRGRGGSRGRMVRGGRPSAGMRGPRTVGPGPRRAGPARGSIGQIAREDRGAVEVQRPIDLGLAAAEFRGQGGVAVGEGQRRQPVEHGGACRAGRGEPLPGRAFAGAVAPPGRPPGVQGEPLVGRDPDGAERRLGRFGLVAAAGGQRPSEPGPVDRDVGRPRPEGVVQGAAGVVEPALAGREVRPGEGHPAVVRRERGGAVEHRAQAGHGRGVEVDDDVRPERGHRLVGPGVGQVMPLPLEEALGLVVPPLLHEQVNQVLTDVRRPWVPPGSPRGPRSAPARPR